MVRQLTSYMEMTPAHASAGAGTGTLHGSGLDLTGCGGVVAVVQMGSIASTGTVNVKGQHSSNNTDWFDIAGSDVALGDSDDNKIAFVEWFHPTARYFRVVVERATANSSLGGAVYYRHRLDIEPADHHGDVSGSVVIS